MILGLRIVLPIGLAAHLSFTFFGKIFDDGVSIFDWFSLKTGLAVFNGDPEGWDYLMGGINAVWFFGLALGTVAAFKINKPADKMVYVSDSNSSIPPGISC